MTRDVPNQAAAARRARRLAPGEQHADLAQALMGALWWGERMLRGIAKQPPGPHGEFKPERPPTFKSAEVLAAKRGRACQDLEQLAMPVVRL